MTKMKPRKRRRRDREVTLKSASSSDSEGLSEDDHELEEEESRWEAKRCVKDKGKGKLIKEEEEQEECESEGKFAKKTTEEVCGICLTGSIERGKLDCCDHYFCFDCIMEWAKVESRCPMCKQRFVTIVRPAINGTRSRCRTFRIPTRDQVYEPSEEEIRLFTDPYQNTVCTECQEAGDEGLLLLCDRCDGAAHTYCVGLGRSVPRGDWYCQACNTFGQESSDEEEEDNVTEGTDAEEGDGLESILTVLVEDVQPISRRRTVARRSRLPSSSEQALPLRRSTRRRAGRRLSRSSSPRLSDEPRTLASPEPRRGFLPSFFEHSVGAARTLFHQRMIQERIQNMRDNWHRYRSGDLDFSSGGCNSPSGDRLRAGLEITSLPSSSTQRASSRETYPQHRVITERVAEDDDVSRAWALMDQARQLEGASVVPPISSGPHPPDSRGKDSKAHVATLLRNKESPTPGQVLPRVTSSRGMEVFLNTRSSATKDSRSSNPRESSLIEKNSRREVKPTERKESVNARGGYYLRDSNRSGSNHSECITSESQDGSNQASTLLEIRNDQEKLQSRNAPKGSEGLRKASLDLPNDDAKKQVVSIVNVELQPLYNSRKIDKQQFKKISRTATHSVLAAAGLKPDSHCVASFGNITCNHTSFASSGHSLMPDCCSSCFQQHVKKLVTSLVKETMGAR